MSGVNFRVSWIDSLRGLAAIAVTLHHVIEGCVRDGYAQSSLKDTWNLYGDYARMPTMMLLAGIFVVPALKKGTMTYFGSKSARILWPYIIWSTFYYFAWMHEGLLPSPTPLSFAAQLLLKPVLHLWFLHALLIYFTVSWIFLRGDASVRNIAIMCVVFLALTSGVSYLVKQFPNFGSPVDMVSRFADSTANITDKLDRLGLLFIFFVFGILMAKARLENLHGVFSAKPKLVAVIAIAGTVAAAVAIGPEKYSLISLPICMSATVGLISLSVICDNVNIIRRALVYIGKFSLEIYLLHLYFALILRRFLSDVVHMDVGFVIILSTVTAIGLSVVVSLLSRRYLLDLPFFFNLGLLRKPTIRRSA